MEQATSSYRRIHESAIKAWRISDPLSASLYALIPLAYYAMMEDLEWPTFVLWILIALVALLIVAHATLIPLVRWRRWQYRIDPAFIDLHYGIFIITKTLVPVKRVQHVATKQGPILRAFGLATVSISTAATTHDIPALHQDEALYVRKQIAELARISNDEL